MPFGNSSYSEKIAAQFGLAEWARSSVPFGNSSYSEVFLGVAILGAVTSMSSVPFGNSSYSERKGRGQMASDLWRPVVSAFRQ